MLTGQVDPRLRLCRPGPLPLYLAAPGGRRTLWASMALVSLLNLGWRVLWGCSGLALSPLSFVLNCGRVFGLFKRFAVSLGLLVRASGSSLTPSLLLAPLQR